MGFLNKLWNLVRFKGWKEDETQEVQPAPEPEQIIEPDEDKLKEAEELEQKKEEKRKEEKEKEEQSKIVPTTKEVEPTPEIKTAIKRFEKGGKITQIQERIDKSQFATVSFKPTKDIGSLKSVYNDLLEKSIISLYMKDGNFDFELFNLIYQNKEKLRHRFSVEFKIMTTNGEAYLAVDAILGEEASDINEFVQEGQTYTSQELIEALDQASRHFEKQYGSIGGSKQAPNGKMQVVSIDVSMTFA